MVVPLPGGRQRGTAVLRRSVHETEYAAWPGGCWRVGRPAAARFGFNQNRNFMILLIFMKLDWQAGAAAPNRPVARGCGAVGVYARNGGGERG